MAHDPTEAYRRDLIESGAIEVQAAVADALEETWTTEQLREQFDVEGFLAPFAIVRRKSDGARGTLRFRHSPRIYFDWKEDK